MVAAGGVQDQATHLDRIGVTSTQTAKPRLGFNISAQKSICINLSPVEYYFDRRQVGIFYTSYDFFPLTSASVDFWRPPKMVPPCSARFAGPIVTLLISLSRLATCFLMASPQSCIRVAFFFCHPLQQNSIEHCLQILPTTAEKAGHFGSAGNQTVLLTPYHVMFYTQSYNKSHIKTWIGPE